MIYIVFQILMTPLHWAVEMKHLETIELLLQNGARTNILNKFDKTVIGIAEDEVDDPNIMRTLRVSIVLGTN